MGSEPTFPCLAPLSPELEFEAESEELDEILFAAVSLGFGSRTMIAKLTGFSER